MNNCLLPEVVEELLQEYQNMPSDPEDDRLNEFAESVLDSANTLSPIFVKHFLSGYNTQHDLLHRSLTVLKIIKWTSKVVPDDNFSTFITPYSDLKYPIAKSAIEILFDNDLLLNDPTVIATIIYLFAREDAHIEGFDALQRLIQIDANVHANIHRFIGEIAYLAGKYETARNELELILDKLDDKWIRNLADSCIKTNSYLDALSYYEKAFCVCNDPRSEYFCVKGKGLALLRLEDWKQAKDILSHAAEPCEEMFCGDEDPWQIQWERAECLKLAGYATARYDWQQPDNKSASQKYLSALYNAAKEDLWKSEYWPDMEEQSDFSNVVLEGDKPENEPRAHICKLVGYSLGLIDIMYDNYDLLTRVISERDEIQRDYIEKDRHYMAQIRKELDIQEYADKLMAQYPGLPENAARHLAFGLALCHKNPRGCPIQWMVAPICAGIERILKDNIITRMFDNTISQNGLKPSDKHYDGNWPRIHKNGTIITPENFTIGNAIHLLKTSKSELASFITSLPKDSRLWLEENAVVKLEKLNSYRNPAAHANPMSYEQVDELRELVFNSGELLHHLLVVGDLLKE